MRPKSKKEAIDLLFAAVIEQATRVFPHMKDTPSGDDPYGIEIIDTGDGEDAISVSDQEVQGFMNEYPRGGLHPTNYYKFSVITSYSDDFDERTFSHQDDAAKYFVLEMVRMRLGIPKAKL